MGSVEESAVGHFFIWREITLNADRARLIEKLFAADTNDLQVVRGIFDLARIEKDLNVGRRVRNLAAQKSREHSMTVKGKEFMVLYWDVMLWLAQNKDFDSFLLYNERKRKPEKRFYQPRRHCIKPIVDAYQQVFDGELDVLTVSQPKRTGKTTLGLMGMLMISGAHPDKSSIAAGRGDDLVASFYEGCLEILNNPDEYSYYEIFPKATLERTDAKLKTIDLEARTRFPTITCRSSSAHFVGSTEATNLLYLDDLVENDIEAKNRARLDDLWDIVRGDIIGRRLEGTPIIAQGTRYSLYDPYGRLQDAAKDAGWRLKVLEIPALDPITDESNFEMVNGEGKKIFTTAFYRNERKLVSEEQWMSQFQQQPFEAKGLLFPKKELHKFRHLPIDVEPDAVIAVCDTAESGEDSVSMPIAYLYGDDVYIKDVVFDNSAPDITKPQCAKKLYDHKVSTAVFESNAAGDYFARDVDKMVGELGGQISIRRKRNISNKQTRIEYASDNVKKNFYFLDDDMYEVNSQYGQFMKELTTYTRTGKVAHDDAPDSIALLENEIRRLTANRATVFKRPF